MIKIISLLLQAAGVSAGVFVALMLKNGQADSHAAPAADAEQGEAGEKGDAKDGDNKKNKKKGDKKKGGDYGDSGEYGFIKFGRQFIVPVVKPDGVNALVVLDINLEVPTDVTETVYAREPKVRDALLSTLLRLSSEGAFNARFTNAENMDQIRGELLEAARAVLGDDVHEVLILSIARQNV